MRYDDELDLKNENSLSIMIKGITPGSTILEFGPSNGRLTKYLKDNLGCSVYIVEIDKEAYEIASEFAKDGICGDIEDLEWHTKFNKISFDFIIFGDVLEHLVNPKKILEKSVELLKDSGKVLISVPNIANNEILINLFNNRFDYTESGILDNSHLRFFTYYTLLEMIEKEGLIVVSEEATYKDQKITDKITRDLADRDFAQVFQFVFACMKYSYYIKNSENILIEKNVIKKRPMYKFKMYLKSGGEYNESCTWSKKIYEGINDIKVDLSQYKAETIRIDFSENSCAVKLNYINLDEKGYNVCNLKGNYEYNKGNIYLFFNDDPYIIIDDIQNISKMEMEFQIQYIEQNTLEAEEFKHYRNDYLQKSINSIAEKDKEIARLSEIIGNKNLEIEEQKSRIRRIIDEKEDLKKIIEAKNLQLIVYENSTCWKITKPIRIIGDFAEKVKNREKPVRNVNSNRLTDEVIPSRAKYKVFVSVIIPTYNGMEYLKEIIDILKNQKHVKKVEIIIVDSGSTDGTVEFCKKEKLKLIEIPNEEFSHSHARNLGAQKAKGDILVFLTQDASPTGDNWVYNMITPIKKYGVVAVSCKQKMRENCEVFFKIMNDAFDFGIEAQDFDYVGKLPEKEDISEIRRNAQLSNNACAIRKDIFRKYKFRNEFNEDLDLGVRLIKDGNQIAILTSERVIHSHNRSCGYYLKRATVDMYAVKNIFPDFELYDRNDYENFASGFICAYVKVCEIIKFIENDKSIVENSNEFIERLLAQVSYDDKFDIENIKFGYLFSDSIMDKLLKDILSSLKEVNKVNYLSLRVKDHIRWPIRRYLNATSGDIKAKGKEDVIDCIFKFFSLLCGTEIANYTMIHPENEFVSNIGKELKKGV